MPPVPPSESSYEIPWSQILTLIGIVGNFIFSWFNYRRTASIRRNNIQTDEFKRLRAPVDIVISNLKSEIINLKGMSASDNESEKLRELVKECNLRISDLYSTLELHLLDFDKSSFADGGDWSSKMSQPYDEFCAAIDGAYNLTKDKTAIKASISKASTKLSEMISLLSSRLDAELKKYTEF